MTETVVSSTHQPKIFKPRNYGVWRPKNPGVRGLKMSEVPGPPRGSGNPGVESLRSIHTYRYVCCDSTAVCHWWCKYLAQACVVYCPLSCFQSLVAYHREVYWDHFYLYYIIMIWQTWIQVITGQIYIYIYLFADDAKICRHITCTYVQTIIRFCRTQWIGFNWSDVYA